MIFGDVGVQWALIGATYSHLLLQGAVYGVDIAYMQYLLYLAGRGGGRGETRYVPGLLPVRLNVMCPASGFLAARSLKYKGRLRREAGQVTSPDPPPGGDQGYRPDDSETLMTRM